MIAATRSSAAKFVPTLQQCRIPSMSKTRSFCESAFQMLERGISFGYPKVVEAALQKGANPNQAYNDGWFALHHAAYTDHAGVVKQLVEAGAWINLRTIKEGDTPLHVACASQAQLATAVLLQHKANFSLLNNDGNTPLETAIQAQSQECTKALINAGANKNALNKKTGFTPLMLACKLGSYQVTSALLYLGASPNLGGITSPAFWAVNHPDVLQLLIDNNASRNGTVSPYFHDEGQIGDTLLHTAVRAVKVKSVELLLKHKVDPKKKNLNTQTPLDLARLMLIDRRLKVADPTKPDPKAQALDKIIGLLDVAEKIFGLPDVANTKR